MRTRSRDLRSIAPRVLAASLLAAACSAPGEAPTAAPSAAPAAAAPAERVAEVPSDAAASSSRSPDEQEQAAMLEILSAETDPGRRAWLAVAAGNSESSALARSLAAIFERAGWKVDVQTLTGMALKPGVSMLVADEVPPAWAESALRALQASGIEVKSAIGYRPYFEEKKRENPEWPGIPLVADQAFVIAVGPEPKE